MRATFKLKHSDQATLFNRDFHDTTLTGDVKYRYDDFTIVVVPGWRFGHTVRTIHTRPVT